MGPGRGSGGVQVRLMKCFVIVVAVKDFRFDGTENSKNAVQDQVYTAKNTRDNQRKFLLHFIKISTNETTKVLTMTTSIRRVECTQRIPCLFFFFVSFFGVVLIR